MIYLSYPGSFVNRVEEDTQFDEIWNAFYLVSDDDVRYEAHLRKDKLKNAYNSGIFAVCQGIVQYHHTVKHHSMKLKEQKLNTSPSMK